MAVPVLAQDAPPPEAPVPAPAPTPAPAAEPAPPAAPASVPFSFDLLTEEMRQAATAAYQEPVRPTGALGDLQYNDYRNINFRADRARWADSSASLFRVAAFHMGWLYSDPVQMFQVAGDTATEMAFSTDDFEYYNNLTDRFQPHLELPGVAGFRLSTPLNRPDVFDELVAFLGASYFRALGRGTSYGMSARGLAVNTASPTQEEFPRFSRFYLEKPADASNTVVVYAALDSPSVTGAYRFIITPGEETVMLVTARIFAREDVAQLGVAPLTSMYMFSENNRANYDDFRPNVHDSDGLGIERRSGDKIWRPLNNPPRLGGSYFGEESPRSFGLFQRDREFENFQDLEARYERRPSVLVEPMGEWGKGIVRLVEIPSDSEVNDNIVAFWVPEGAFNKGDAREFAYSLRWGALSPDPQAALAFVAETRTGQGGVSGVDNSANFRKFVVDFQGGVIANLPMDAKLDPVINVQNGEVEHSALVRIPESNMWRLVIDVRGTKGQVVELGAHIAGYGRKLSETWLYQWMNA
ncbi:glucan biosynthesis protein [Falsirhodobacter sp. 20TX0035]|uniref:glucan biosynthesis protein n=1 Tax=Falsirhodobacter sp. 20TX0035 TaxID=3022019 RepID=UPI00232CF2AB|nr:glucan biosynthesis protein [Falsirhodobacter sp. 20TX0035]MDB6453303.1 glucan biosynthesis protein [Falsirhodobacter sp. 20TX0035]